MATKNCRHVIQKKNYPCDCWNIAKVIETLKFNKNIKKSRCDFFLLKMAIMTLLILYPFDIKIQQLKLFLGMKWLLGMPYTNFDSPPPKQIVFAFLVPIGGKQIFTKRPLQTTIKIDCRKMKFQNLDSLLETTQHLKLCFWIIRVFKP